MAMTQNTVVVGVFYDKAQANQAIEELKQAGFNDDEIGFLARSRVVGKDAAKAANTAAGILEGGVIGGVLGAAASLLIPGIGPAVAGGILATTLGGATLGAAAGGLIGSFVKFGIPEKDAQFYQQELEAGHTVIVVKTPSAEGYRDALAIMRKHGAYDAETQAGIINATPPIRPYGTDTPQETKDTD
ncbi:heat induced stress protein YflT [Thermosporothrix hazakensis]|jgi:outer membrane lipoprotein SlyB|uniref:Heat induced stress protein YflT n=1 Tax=Thermosporothrix hazakensis TaxID=644383 RepID=A0A326UCQ7_THEHA|nr:general stress protein [Thermosporothrix hazakensis]PZW26612.1 heat induced stress protein YflT [Thermosporothrix hazakensis]GCE47688.1 hypothetical protein KTH_25570 [Thermosporothrix hazakensis]